MSSKSTSADDIDADADVDVDVDVLLDLLVEDAACFLATACLMT